MLKLLGVVKITVCIGFQPQCVLVKYEVIVADSQVSVAGRYLTLPFADQFGMFLHNPFLCRMYHTTVPIRYTVRSVCRAFDIGGRIPVHTIQRWQPWHDPMEEKLPPTTRASAIILLPVLYLPTAAFDLISMGSETQQPSPNTETSDRHPR